MKILFDANVPKGLRRYLLAHEVHTAQEQGWGATKNGHLLQAAESAGFKALVTADKNLSYQQNLKNRKIASVVLPTNDWSLLKTLVPSIVKAIALTTPNSFQMIEVSGRLRPR